MIWIIQRTWKSCQFFFCLIWLSGCSVLLSPPWLGWFGGRSEASSFDFFQCFELKKKQFSITLFELPVMSCFKGNFWSRMPNIVSCGSLDGEMYFGCIVKSIVYIAVSSMETSVRLVFLGADCMVTDCKRIHKQRLHYFSGLNLFFGKFWIFCYFCFFLLGGVAVI